MSNSLLFSLVMQFISVVFSTEFHECTSWNQYEIKSISDVTNGAIVNGIDFCELDYNNLNQSIITSLISDVHRYEFVIFKNQCHNHNLQIPAKTLENIGSQFGTPFTAAYLPISSTRSKERSIGNITIFSNDASKCTMETRAGTRWHIDGTYLAKPSNIVLQHIVNVPNFGYGATELLSSNSALKLLKETKPNLYHQWNKLYMVSTTGCIHPIIAKHPITNKECIILLTHLPFITQVIQVLDEKMLFEVNNDFKGKCIPQLPYYNKLHDTRLKLWTKDERQTLLQEIEDFIELDCRNNNLVYNTQYESGDLLIRDNLAVLHRGHPSVYQSVDEIGLRVLWRLVLAGEYVSSK
eukprot:341513_1